MWIVTETPTNYKNGPGATNNWCILDSDDGDVYNFYETKELAEAGYKVAFGVDWAVAEAEYKREQERYSRNEDLVITTEAVNDDGYKSVGQEMISEQKRSRDGGH